ncbi:type II secretion system GspH family protein [Shewanella sp. SW32]|uniref:type II secretion system protein n=1 Tax=unclassified Shewanella TaxID=196818 RepID=UPI0021D9A425|nr:MULTISPECIES: type II secretion system protein [unclassified Shewanella]MCU7961921.1 type II secretion system GspH family protein [Shewanella sp. SW32]MCU7969853.1 type II secretion system GspH family protein [Shewanella sp. SW29]MCU7987048.1 type II secretion system GspH family protein [Shewanella sp. SW24]
MRSNALSKGHIQARLLGFTLIELVIGMLVIGIAIVMLTSMLFPQADRAASTLHRVRSAELAHSVMNEIWGKRYDQNTNANGGTPACGSPLGSNCPTSLGPEFGESRNNFNDVDDYKGLNETATMLNSTQTYANAYPNYHLSVTVAYGAVSNTKLVTINVTTPDNEVITYNMVRSNY